MSVSINGTNQGMPYINGVKYNAYINGQQVWKTIVMPNICYLTSVVTPSSGPGTVCFDYSPYNEPLWITKQDPVPPCIEGNELCEEHGQVRVYNFDGVLQYSTVPTSLTSIACDDYGTNKIVFYVSCIHHGG